MGKDFVPVSKEHLFNRVCQILENARANTVRTVNKEMTQAYWLIGKEIVNEEQLGSKRAEYGKAIVERLSKRLTDKYGKGWSASHLWHIRQFYLMYKDRTFPILHTLCTESGGSQILHTLCAELSWSHYRLLMRVENENIRRFYEIEAVQNNWPVRQLERQINSLLFERLLKSRDKKGLMRLANKGQEIQRPEDVLKDPLVLEFLNLPESHKLAESKLESALIDNLKDFLLELGKGFAFVERQRRLTLDGDHFYIDLVFYHTILKCYVLIDLKTAKLTHADLGQMQLYVNYFDRELRNSGDGPTIGLILCTDKNDTVVKYTLAKGKQMIFASKYKLYLPTEKELIKEIEAEKRQLEFKKLLKK